MLRASYLYLNEEVLLNDFAPSNIVLIEDTVYPDACDATVLGDVLDPRFGPSELAVDKVKHLHYKSSMRHTKGFLDPQRVFEDVSNLLGYSQDNQEGPTWSRNPKFAK